MESATNRAMAHRGAELKLSATDAPPHAIPCRITSRISLWQCLEFRGRCRRLQMSAFRSYVTRARHSGRVTCASLGSRAGRKYTSAEMDGLGDATRVCYAVHANHRGNQARHTMG